MEGLHAVVVIGGSPPHADVGDRLPAPAMVVAADSGVDIALAMGLRVAAVVGDLDSASAAAVIDAEAAGALVERHPADKDATDVELALDWALAHGAGSVTLVSGIGDRLDHLLGALGALADRRFSGVPVDGWVGEAWVGVVHGGDTLVVSGSPGEYVSLVPIGGAAAGVRTTGLRWPLDGDTLTPTSTRGISNELIAESASVALDAGALLVIRPYALRPRPT